MFNDGDLTVVEADGNSPKVDQALKATLSICLVSLESFIHLFNEYLLNPSYMLFIRPSAGRKQWKKPFLSSWGDRSKQSFTIELDQCSAGINTVRLALEWAKAPGSQGCVLWTIAFRQVLGEGESTVDMTDTWIFVFGGTNLWLWIDLGWRHGSTVLSSSNYRKSLPYEQVSILIVHS